MYSNLTKKILLSTLIVFITACSSIQTNQAPLTVEDIASKEKLYESTRNYSGLVSIYREVLKGNDDPSIRYKLSDSYYKKGDSRSALLYVAPLLDHPQFIEKATILKVKALIQLREYQQAIESATALIARYPNNVEAYNSRGIAYAQVGKLNDAQYDFAKSRELFIDDVVAINNLAMLQIINGDYKNAVQLLLPQYLNGEKEQRLLHNLVFALVKSGKTDYALDIIKKEHLNTSADDLVNALKKTQKVSKTISVTK
ncbi:tight adherence protein D [Bisgaardia hudsonensis]|uniref:Tight adherence protein D n=1 Tax=Bisgaardia hudsonensis TaxID=109472 RepID=A0A4R2MXI3_9PAST|nr:tetratricopeptide repeat protein [Bisgaardia hudsonensis]QLB12349.1 NrfG protein [Bisgaardia hudsonensis]TCP12397.1 tight adherence protein D [Bisgaardia hudsonensis]